MQSSTVDNSLRGNSRQGKTADNAANFLWLIRKHYNETEVAFHLNIVVNSL
jgi:hypothetical protein